MPVDPLVAWRRIALDKQLPAPRFPGGVRAPSIALLCCLLLLAGVCGVYLGLFSGRVIPQAVVDSQDRLVTGLARSLSTAVTESVEQIEARAAEYQPGADPAALLTPAADTTTTWAGTAVLDASTRQPVAARGEPVPVAAVPPDVAGTTVTPLIQAAQPRALIVAPLPDGRLVAGTAVLRLRQLRLAPEARQAVLVGLPSGESTVVQGQAPPAGDLIRRTLADTADGPVVRATGGGTPDSALLVVAAPVGSLGLAVASTMTAPVVDVGSRWKGVPPAAGLVAAALLAYLVARAGLVRPVRRLLVRAKDAACGATDPRGIAGPSEVRRIDAALTGPPGMAGQATKEPRQTRLRPAQSRRRGLPAAVALLGAAAIILGWSGAIGYAFAAGPVEVPRQVVLDMENQVTAATDALGQTLDGGLRQLTVAAASNAQTAPDQLGPALDRLIEEESGYRGAYVTDAEGKVVVAAGRPPLRLEGRLPDRSGIRLANTGGRLPVVYAHARRPDGTSIVAEFDVPRLADLLRRADGRVRVVDSELRTILDTEGFRAFQPLPGGSSRAAATAAFQGRTAASVSGTDLIAGTPLAAPGSTAGLKWSVVAQQPVGELALPANGLRRAALVLGGAAGGLALLALGWHYFVLLRPLRRLAARADRLAQGHTEEVISPHRPDEIGAIASCLEICRQVRVHGPSRLGGAARMRGSNAQPTVVIRRPPTRRRFVHRRARRR